MNSVFFYYAFIAIESSGVVPPPVLTLTRVVIALAFIWCNLFIFNCQDFVVAGAASKWYFARVKSCVNHPVLTSFKHLKYHLGSVSFGSFMVTLVKLARALLTENDVRLSRYLRIRKPSSILLRGIISLDQFVFKFSKI